MGRIPKNSVGLAGEFAVLSKLALCGYDAGLTLGNTKNIDILVYDPASGDRKELEVKTNLEKRNGPSDSKLFGRFVTDWQMDEKHETIDKPTLFYCFVHINAPEDDLTKAAFRFFIVPSGVVARYVRAQHEHWLKTDPRRASTSRRLFRIGLPNDRDISVPAPLASVYENNWRFERGS